MANKPPDVGLSATNMQDPLQSFLGSRTLDKVNQLRSLDHPCTLGSYFTTCNTSIKGRSLVDTAVQRTCAPHDSHNLRMHSNEGIQRLGDDATRVEMNLVMAENTFENPLGMVVRPGELHLPFRSAEAVDATTARDYTKEQHSRAYPPGPYPRLSHPISSLHPILARPPVYRQQHLDPYDTVLHPFINAYGMNGQTGYSASNSIALNHSFPGINPYQDFSQSERDMYARQNKFPQLYPLNQQKNSLNVDSCFISQCNQKKDEIPHYLNYAKSHPTACNLKRDTMLNVPYSQKPIHGLKTSGTDLAGSSSSNCNLHSEKFNSVGHESVLKENSSRASIGNQNGRNLKTVDGMLAHPHSTGKPMSVLLPYSSPLPPYSTDLLNVVDNCVSDASPPYSSNKDQIHSGMHVWNNPTQQMTPPKLGIVVTPKAKEITFDYPESTTKKDKHNDTCCAFLKKDLPSCQNLFHQNYGEEHAAHHKIPPAWQAQNGKLPSIEKDVMHAAREHKSFVNYTEKYSATQSQYSQINSKHIGVVDTSEDSIRQEYGQLEHAAQACVGRHEAKRNSVIQSTSKLSGDIHFDDVNGQIAKNLESGAMMCSNKSAVKESPSRSPNIEPQLSTDNVTRTDTFPSITDDTCTRFSPDSVKSEVNPLFIGKDCSLEDGSSYPKKIAIVTKRGRRKADSSRNRPSVTCLEMKCIDQDVLVKKGTTEALATSNEKNARPQRKSGGTDFDNQYLYGCLFSDEETENDDSSDEDYNCPSNVSKFKTIRPSKMLRRTRRATRTQDDFLNCYKAEVWTKTVPPESKLNCSRLIPESDKNIGSNGTVHRLRHHLITQNDDKHEGQITEKSFAKNTSKCSTDGVAQEVEIGQKLCNAVSDKNSDEPFTSTGVEAVQKKRKYTRKLDEHGNPVKRKKRKVKSTEVVPRQRRKYIKKSEKWFKNKVGHKLTFDSPSVTFTSKHEAHGPMDGTAHPDVCLSGYIQLHEKPDAILDDESKSEVSSSVSGHVMGKTGKDARMNHSFILRNDIVLSSTTKGCTTGYKPSTKSEKKLGKTFGCRKYRRQANGMLSMATANTASKLKKRCKNSKGDGLRRFGMRRKRGKKGNRLKKLNMDSTIGNNSSPIAQVSNSSIPSKNSEKGTKRLKRRYDNSRRLEKKRQRLMNLGFLGAKDEKKPRATTSLATKSHRLLGVSLELQEQEYDFNVADIITNEANQTIDADARKTMESDSSYVDCSPLLIRTPTFSMNLKKLSCNSAIGETALHKAARLGYVENIQFYLETGSSVNQCDNAGYTALHKACVHNNLESATMLLQYGADVNKHAGDGTRPFHDAVEYDHLEGARLMLACGADPMLSKFSGRGVQNMIHSEHMGQFINAYLKGLEEPSVDTNEDDLHWKFTCSSILDSTLCHAYSALSYPPDNSINFVAEFELCDKLPFPTYILQPDEETEWANFCLLEDYMKAMLSFKHETNENPIRIITMPTNKFLEQVYANNVLCILYERSKSKPDVSATYVEIVVVDEKLKANIGTETVKIPIFDDHAHCYLET